MLLSWRIDFTGKSLCLISVALLFFFHCCKSALPSVRSASFRLAQDEGFQISSRDLEVLFDKGETRLLEEYGGVNGLSSLLQTSLDNGIEAAETEIKRRTSAFGTNAFPEKVQKSFLSFLYDASQVR